MPFPGTTSESLLKGLRDGDPDKQREFVEKYGPWALSIIGKLRSDFQEATSEDAWQEVLRELLAEKKDKLEKFVRQGPGTFRGYLKQFVRNVVLRFMHDRARRQKLLEELADQKSQLSREVDRFELVDLIANAGAHIREVFPPIYWEMFLRRVYYEHRISDIAQNSGYARGKVREVVQKVLRELRAIAPQLRDYRE